MEELDFKANIKDLIFPLNGPCDRDIKHENGDCVSSFASTSYCAVILGEDQIKKEVGLENNNGSVAENFPDSNGGWNEQTICEMVESRQELARFNGRKSIRENLHKFPSIDSSDEDFDFEESDSSSSSQYSSESEENLEKESNSATLDDWLPILPQHRHFPFTGYEGLLMDIPKDRDSKVLPIDFYKMFITDDILEMIAVATNTYAQEARENCPNMQRSRLSLWRDTSPGEIMNFFAIIIYMGLVHKPDVSLYWSKSVIYQDSFVPKVMSRERFQLLWGYIHFAVTMDELNQSNSLYKVKPLLDKLVFQFQNVYQPGADLILTESIFPSKGKLGNKHNLSENSLKYGVKLYKLCTPDAYTWNILVNPGGTFTQNGHSPTESLSLIICDKLLNEGRTLYGDSNLSSVSLAEFLLSKNTYYCGTLRANRNDIGEDVKLANLNRGEMKSAVNRNGVKVYNWQAKRNIFTLSTVPEHGAGLVPTRKKNRNGEVILKPPSLLSYGKVKKQIDVSDQLSSYYSVVQKPKKWYRKLAFEVVCGIAVVNAHILYQKYSGDNKMNFRKFSESLILSITTGHPTENLRYAKRKVNESSMNLQVHMIREALGPKGKTRKRCRGCYEKLSKKEGCKVACNKAKRVTTFCPECPQKPFLCLSCFAEKHS